MVDRLRPKITYQLSVRQILLIALTSAFVAAIVISSLNYWNRRLQSNGAPFSETPPAGITDPSVATDERNNIEIYRAVSPGVVSITSISGGRSLFDPVPREGTGSGSVIDEEGHILTNDHVIADARQVLVSFGGDKVYRARVVGRDPDTDLAVIKVDNVPRNLLRVIPFGDSDQLVVGQKVLAIGNPFGFDRTLTTGIISGLQRPIYSQATGRLIEAIQTDASINPGNSGGPLLDSHGRMIGINSQIISPSGAFAGVGFAVPINVAKRVVPQLINNGYVIRPKLGIYTRDVRPELGLPIDEGVIIVQVEQGGSAAAAGLRGISVTPDGDYVLGDIIVAIDGERVRNRDDLTRILDRHEVGDVVQVEVWRDGNRVRVPVRLLPERRSLFRR